MLALRLSPEVAETCLPRGDSWHTKHCPGVVCVGGVGGSHKAPVHMRHLQRRTRGTHLEIIQGLHSRLVPVRVSREGADSMAFTS